MTPIFPEATLWNEVDGYAGTTDLYCSINGVLALIDYKSKLLQNGRFGPPTPKPQVEQQLHAAAFATERHVESEHRWVPVSLRPRLLIAAMVTDNGYSRTRWPASMTRGPSRSSRRCGSCGRTDMTKRCRGSRSSGRWPRHLRRGARWAGDEARTGGVVVAAHGATHSRPPVCRMVVT